MVQHNSGACLTLQQSVHPKLSRYWRRISTVRPRCHRSMSSSIRRTDGEGHVGIIPRSGLTRENNANSYIIDSITKADSKESNLYYLSFTHGDVHCPYLTMSCYVMPCHVERAVDSENLQQGLKITETSPVGDEQVYHQDSQCLHSALFVIKR